MTQSANLDLNNAPDTVATWGTIPVGEGRVQVRHIIMWLGVALWLLPTFIMTGVHGIAWFSFNIAFILILIAATSTVRSVSLHKLAICFLAGGLFNGLDLALSVPAINAIGQAFPLRQFLTVPLEEISKLLAVLLLLFRGRKFSTWTLGATDLLLMGAAVGAGFAFVEDSFLHALQKSALSNLSVLVPASDLVNGRVVVGHAIWTAMASGTIGIGWLFRHEKRLAWPMYLLGFLVATADHIALNYANFGAAVLWLQSLLNAVSGNGFVALAMFVLVIASTISIDSMISLKNLPKSKEFKFPTRKDRKESLLSLWDCIVDLRRLNYAYFRYRQYSGSIEPPTSLSMTVAILAKRLVNRYMDVEPVSASLSTGVFGQATLVQQNTPPSQNRAGTASSAQAKLINSAANLPIVSNILNAMTGDRLPSMPPLNNQDLGPSPATRGVSGGFAPLPNRPLKDQIDLPERYQLREEAFKGGMGIVFRARHKLTKAQLAIKILQPHLADNTNYLARFEQEAKTASQLKHPNIVTVMDFGTTPNQIAYLVMEWLEGPSLEKVVKLSGPMSAQRFLEIFIQTTNALAHAHRKGVIHRDIKPSNIILTVSDVSADNVKIVDFGIAKVINENDPESMESSLNLTNMGDLLGSPFFMSPEQCIGGKIDARSDIYSLGCVMYEALCGVPPITGDNPAQVYHKHATEMPKQPRSINPSIPKPELFEPMLFKCLQKDPAKRYNSMEELEQELKIIRDAL